MLFFVTDRVAPKCRPQSTPGALRFLMSGGSFLSGPGRTWPQPHAWRVGCASSDRRLRNVHRRRNTCISPERGVVPFPPGELDVVIRRVPSELSLPGGLGTGLGEASQP